MAVNSCDGCVKRTIFQRVLGHTIELGHHGDEVRDDVAIQFKLRRQAMEEFARKKALIQRNEFTKVEWGKVHSELSVSMLPLDEDECEELFEEAVSNAVESAKSEEQNTGCCRGCAVLDAINFERSMIIKGQSFQEITLTVSKKDLEKLFFKNYDRPSAERNDSRNVNYNFDFSFKDHEYEDIKITWEKFKVTWEYHIYTDHCDARHGLVDTMWSSDAGIPVQVIWDRGCFYGFDLFDVRIQNKTLGEVTPDDLRAGVWDQIGDHLREQGWRFEEIWFKRFGGFFEQPHRNDKDFIGNDGDEEVEFLQNLIMEDPNFEMVLVDMGLTSDEEETEEEEDDEEEGREYETVSLVPQHAGVRTLYCEFMLGAHRPHPFCFKVLYDNTTVGREVRNFFEEHHGITWNEYVVTVNLGRDSMRVNLDSEALLVNLVRQGQCIYFHEIESGDEHFTVYVKMVNETRVKNFEGHSLKRVVDFRFEVALSYGIRFSDFRLVHRDNDLWDDGMTFRDAGIESETTILVMPVGRGGGGTKRTIADREEEKEVTLKTMMEKMNSNNMFMGVVHQLHKEVQKKDGSLFKNFVGLMSLEQLQVLDQDWNNCSYSMVEKVVGAIWKSLHPNLNFIHRAEEDAKSAKKVIALLLELAYLHDFQSDNGENLVHSRFEALMEDRVKNILQEEEIQRRVNEHLYPTPNSVAPTTGATSSVGVNPAGAMHVSAGATPSSSGTAPLNSLALSFGALNMSDDEDL